MCVFVEVDLCCHLGCLKPFPKLSLIVSTINFALVSQFNTGGDSNVRAVVLTGAGNAFIAGADIKAFVDMFANSG